MRLALAAVAVCGAGCFGESAVRSPLPAAAVGQSVLSVQWRMRLTTPDLLEYKPQEFAAAASDGTRVFIGSRGGRFYALRVSDGQRLWEKRIDAGVSARPLYLETEKLVFVGGDDGTMYALDPATGKERWTYHTKGPIQGVPVYDDGALYFTNGENRVYCVDARDGSWRWQYDREAPESFTIHGFAGPLVYGGRVYCGFADGYLATLNAKTGDVIWARSLAGEATRFVDVDSTPVIVDGVLYVTSYSGGVYALEPSDGAVKWRFEAEGAGSVRVAEGRIYFGAAKGGLHCLDDKGRLVWRQALAAQGGLSTPLLVGERLLLVSASEGGTYVVDRRRGKLLQFFGPGDGVTAEPVSDGKHVYVLTNAGFFYAFRLGAG